jgi:hypothetical protein
MQNLWTTTDFDSFQIAFNTSVNANCSFHTRPSLTLREQGLAVAVAQVPVDRKPDAGDVVVFSVTVTPSNKTWCCGSVYDVLVAVDLDNTLAMVLPAWTNATRGNITFDSVLVNTLYVNVSDIGVSDSMVIYVAAALKDNLRPGQNVRVFDDTVLVRFT